MEHRKSLSTMGVFSLGAGAMISSGLFILPSVAFAEAGAGVLAAYFIAGFCMLPAIFTKLELSSAMPKTGGSFFYLARIFGAPVGVITGFADWFSIALKSAFALVGIGVLGSLVFPGFGELEFKLIAVGACVFFMLLNLFSVKSAGRFQIAMVVFMMAILLVFILVGYRKMDFSHFRTRFDVADILSATGLVFISYGGLTKIGTLVEEVKDAENVMVPGLLSAFFTVQAVYLLVLFVTVGAMDGGTLASSYSPLTDAAAAFSPDGFGRGGLVFAMAAAGFLAFFTTANAGILSASRVPFAMSRDGMLPAVFGRMTNRGIPAWSVLATGLFIIVSVAALDVKELAKVASLFLMFVFLLENIGLLVIRASKLATYRPVFRSPLFPWMQIVGIAVYCVLIASEGLLPLSIAGGFVVLALVWHLVYARKGWSKTSAFVTMLKKAFGPELASEGKDLEDELLSILLERDSIREDRFDALVREAPVIDYPGTVTRAELFHDVSEILAKRHGLDAKTLERKFTEREDQTSTLIYPGVAIPHAIPHVVLEGESIFDLVLVRARFGILWTNGEVVYTAFCLAGSRDERNFHLRALMSIAQALQDPAFTRAWHSSQNARELVTALMLARRKRHHDPGS